LQALLQAFAGLQKQCSKPEKDLIGSFSVFHRVALYITKDDGYFPYLSQRTQCTIEK